MNKACLRPTCFQRGPTTALRENSTGEYTPGNNPNAPPQYFVLSQKVVVSVERKYA